MKLEIEEPNSKIYLKDIIEFENKYGINLPEDYKTFLLETNGGIPQKNLFMFTHFKFGNEGNGFGIVRFWDLKSLEPFADVFPENLLWIATAEPDCILLSISGEDKGKVYHFDFDFQNDEDEADYSNLSLLANSFDEFMNSFSYPYAHKFEELCEKEDIEGLKNLIQSGFDVNLKNWIKHSTITLVLQKGLPSELIQMILDRNYVIDDETLYYIAQMGNIEVVQMLLNKKIDINKILYSSKQQGTMLIYASLYPSFDVMNFLIENGADIDIKDSTGKRAIDCVKYKLDNENMNEDSKNSFEKAYKILLEAEKKQGSGN